jgi:hypothetical protein
LDSSRRSDTELIAVSVDSRDLLQTMANKIEKDGTKADFLFLSDAGQVIDQSRSPESRRTGLAASTTYVIDRKASSVEVHGNQLQDPPNQRDDPQALDRVKEAVRHCSAAGFRGSRSRWWWWRHLPAWQNHDPYQPRASVCGAGAFHSGRRAHAGRLQGIAIAGERVGDMVRSVS